MIEIKHLSKTFQMKDGAVNALTDINLTIPDGSIYGIIGMSGAGKSTLVRCINLLERPTEGSVVIDGTAMETLNAAQLRERRREITMIFQQFNLLMQRSCLRNICFPMELAGVKKADAEKRAKELLEMVGLPDKANAYPAQLSGGQKQRIAIARALATNPKVLLCDEATSALDPNTTHSILQLIRDINKKLGITCIIITHQMSVVEEICDSVAILDGGVVVENGSVAEIFANPKVLLCDEATSALDPKTTRQILELIRDINQKLHITVVIITHQMSVVKEVCSHVAILDDGCVAEEGLVGTVFAAPKSEVGRRLVFPGGADAQVYNPQDEKLVRLVFKDSKTTSIPLIARLAAEEGVFCNVISASTQKLSETVYGSMMLGIPSAQYDKAVAFIHNVANVQVEEVDHHVQ